MSSFEHIELNIAWSKVLEHVSASFAGVKDVKDIIFLIGVQELGQNHRSFSKEEKIDIMHIGLCAILSPFGFYVYEGRDKDGWPHWKSVKKLPALSEKDREVLIKEAIVTYFKDSSPL